MTSKLTKKARAHLDEMISEATVDCYTDDEAKVGMQISVAEGIVCPFSARVIGEDVEVVELREAEFGFGVEAICRFKGKDYRVNIDSLEWPKKKPAGFEWVEAYRYFRSGRI